MATNKVPITALLDTLFAQALRYFLAHSQVALVHGEVELVDPQRAAAEAASRIVRKEPNGVTPKRCRKALIGVGWDLKPETPALEVIAAAETYLTQRLEKTHGVLEVMSIRKQRALVLSGKIESLRAMQNRSLRQ